MYPKHCARVVLNTADVKFFQELVWKMGTHSDLLKMGAVHAVLEEYSLKLTAAQYINCIGYSFLASKRIEPEHLGYYS